MHWLEAVGNECIEVVFLVVIICRTLFSTELTKRRHDGNVLEQEFYDCWFLKREQTVTVFNKALTSGW